METNQLQKLINQKAENKLENDLHLLHKTILNQPLFRSESSKMPRILIFEKSRNGSETIHKCIDPIALMSENNSFREELKKYWLPIYIERETSEFLGQVENLNSQISELLNAQLNSDD